MSKQFSFRRVTEEQIFSWKYLGLQFLCFLSLFWVTGCATYSSYVLHDKIAKEVRESIKNEQSISVDSIPENTIAVFYFTNTTGNPEYDYLPKGLTAMIITDLTQVKSLKILERIQIQVLIDELKISKTGLFDQSTVPRYGRLLGARRIMNGELAMPGKDQLKISAVATNVATIQNDAMAESSGNQDQFFVMEKELVFRILDDLKITLTQEERNAIQKIPTQSFKAFLAYCRGLDYEDKGFYREALREFRNASIMDSGFMDAGEKMQDMQTIEKNIDGANRLAPISQNIAVGLFPTAIGVENERTQQTEKALNVVIEW